MDAIVDSLIHFIQNIEQSEYIAFGVVLIFLFLLIHLFFVKKEKKKKHDKITQNVKVFQKAFNNVKDSMLIISNTNEIMYYNQSMMDLLGIEEKTAQQTLHKTSEINIKRQWIPLSDFIKSQREKIGDGVLTFPQTLFRSSKSSEIKINLHLDILLFGKKSHYTIVTIQDLSYMQKFDDMVFKHQLTSLPNQTKVLQELPMLFSKIHTENNKIALILLSLDNFSSLRSIIGFKQSNEVILKFSKYLSTIVSEMHISIYHTFDNHFLLTVSNVESAEKVTELVNNIQSKLATFYKMDDVNLHLTVSSGIALYPDSGSTGTLLDNAYKALSQAQDEGDNKVLVYNSVSNKGKFDELRLHNDMQSALTKGEFEVYYQPIVRTDTEEVVAAEALIRWIHPELGFIPPDVFIELMEKTGFIIKLGQYVLEEVLKQQKRWELFKFKNIEVSINVSMVEIATGSFVEHVYTQLCHHQVQPTKIKFEITEGMAMIGEVQTEKYFHQLKKLGVGIALDDFGTGYTSFTYLKKFPADILKIDKTLIDNILTNEEDQRIVHAMIELGHNMGMKVVVEGIETKKMVEIITAYGADYIQGYYFSKPLPVFEFQKLLRDEKVEK